MGIGARTVGIVVAAGFASGCGTDEDPTVEVSGDQVDYEVDAVVPKGQFN